MRWCVMTVELCHSRQGMSDADLEKAKVNLTKICADLGCEYKQMTENRTGKNGKGADFLLRYE
jgi:hypothetical protein